MHPLFFKRPVFGILVFVVIILTLLTAGCSAKYSKMVPDSYEVRNTQPYTVSLNDSVGGENPKPLWSSQISNAEFTTALKASLEQSGVFNDVTTGDGADYILAVKILNYDRPWNGANMNVCMETKWELTDSKTKKKVWSDTFETNYTAVWASSLTDVGRIQKAHEGAARTNIKEGIRRLSMVNL